MKATNRKRSNVFLLHVSFLNLPPLISKRKNRKQGGRKEGNEKIKAIPPPKFSMSIKGKGAT